MIFDCIESLTTLLTLESIKRFAARHRKDRDTIIDPNMTANPLTAEDSAKWRDYMRWRSRMALRAYRAVFASDRSFQSKDAYARARDVHAFFTHAAMVARVFLPVSRRATARGAALRKTIGIANEPFQACLAARHNLDHFDERIDVLLLKQPQDTNVSAVSMSLRNRDSLDRILKGKPLAAMLCYLQEEHAVVTCSREGAMLITPLEPIKRELEHVESRCIQIRRSEVTA